MILTRRQFFSTALASTAFAAPALAEAEPFPVREADAKLIEYKYRRREVAYETAEPQGTVIVDPRQRFLFHVLGGGQAMRYGASVGKAGRRWTGASVIGKKAKWPKWTPTPEHVAEIPAGRHAGRP